MNKKNELIEKIQKIKQKMERRKNKATKEINHLENIDKSNYGYRNLGFYQGLEYAYYEICDEIDELFQNKV